MDQILRNVHKTFGQTRKKREAYESLNQVKDLTNCMTTGTQFGIAAGCVNGIARSTSNILKKATAGQLIKTGPGQIAMESAKTTMTSVRNWTELGAIFGAAYGVCEVISHRSEMIREAAVKESDKIIAQRQKQVIVQKHTMNSPPMRRTNNLVFDAASHTLKKVR